MGTDKRERQKANRQARLEQLAKEQQRAKTKKRTVQVAVVIAAAIVVALLFAIFGGKDTSSGPSTTTATSAAAQGASTTSGGSASAETTATSEPGRSITGATPCPEADGSSPRTIHFEQAPPMCIDPAKTYSAKVETNLGDLTISLDAQAAPLAVNNFVVLARYKYFDGTICPRAVPDFVVQCGTPDGTTAGSPGYTIPDELPASASAYVKGAVAMGNTGRPDSSGSQWFIVTSDTGGTKLAPSYTLFGKVADTSSLSVLGAMNALATPSETPSSVIQILRVTITER